MDDMKDEIWRLEQSIYEGRKKGDLSTYLANMSPNYIGPSADGGPASGRAEVQASAKRMVGDAKEELSLSFKSFTMHGDTAVVYYHSHRTVLPNGDKTDERFEVLHVWAREGEGWRLLASMPRKLESSVGDT